jgi:phenylacetic acid degradation operon negative regulatory protein
VKATAKRIILELLSASDGHEATAASLVAAGKLLGVADGSVRVALTRLVADGTLAVTERGVYRLGGGAIAVNREVTSWRLLERQVRRWDGSWVCVQLAGSAARRRERALRLLGFRALTDDLAVRPDNVAGGVAALRDRLHALGVEGSALVFRATDLDADTDARARRLWDRDKLSASYHQWCERIARWLVDIEQVPLRRAARDAFYFGGDVLRAIVFDPRLPEELVDVAARRALLAAAQRVDATGRALWNQLVGLSHGLVFTQEHRDELELA